MSVTSLSVPLLIFKMRTTVSAQELPFMKQRQKDHRLRASLGYIVRPDLKTKSAGKVAQWVKALAAEPDGLMVQGGN